MTTTSTSGVIELQHGWTNKGQSIRPVVLIRNLCDTHVVVVIVVMVVGLPLHIKFVPTLYFGYHLDYRCCGCRSVIVVGSGGGGCGWWYQQPHGLEYPIGRCCCCCCCCCCLVLLWYDQTILYRWCTMPQRVSLRIV